MAGLVFGAVAPHGSSIISELAGSEREAFKPTREAMEVLGNKIKSYKPDTIVILTPHGLKLHGHNAVYLCENCSGSLSDNGNTVSAHFKCDQALAKDILQRAQNQGIPCIGVNYGTASGEYSDIQMDWGTLIPLWYCGARDEVKPQIVVIGPSRDVSLEKLVELGKVIATAAKESGKNIVLIASADQGHAHDPNGIYGFDPASKEYDEQIVDIIKENRLEKLLNFDMGFIEKAKPDSLWQMTILYGATQVVPMTSEFLNYNMPSYFGMLVAGFEVI